MALPVPHPKPPRQRLPEERPAQILDAALAVFGEKGLAGARLEDIAARAGVAKGTIYLYFPNKEALFREMVLSTIVARLEQAERDVAVRAAGSSRDELAQYLRDWWAFLHAGKYETIYRLVIGELHQFPDLAEFYAREVIERALNLLGGIVARGVERGEFRADADPFVAARFISGSLVSHALWCGRREVFKHVSTCSDEQILHDLTDFVLHALQPDHGTHAAAATAARKRK